MARKEGARLFAEMQPGATSLVPQGFDQILTRQELSDVIAFLKASARKLR